MATATRHMVYGALGLGESWTLVPSLAAELAVA